MNLTGQALNEGLLNIETMSFKVEWSILEQLCTSRVEKKCTWPSVRSQVESHVLLLRKGRLAKFADKVYFMLDATPPIAIDT